jgi:hypothetical protein
MHKGGALALGVWLVVVGVFAGLLLFRLSRVLSYLFFFALLATVRGGTSFLCPTAV